MAALQLYCLPKPDQLGSVFSASLQLTKNCLKMAVSNPSITLVTFVVLGSPLSARSLSATAYTFTFSSLLAPCTPTPLS